MKATILRKDIPALELRKRAKIERDAKVCRRLLGIAHLLEGGRRFEAEKITCLSTNVFRVWLKRFNNFGMEGLGHKKGAGRPPKLSPEIEQALKEKVLAGPSQDENRVRYRIVDLQTYLKQTHNIEMGLSGIWYILQGLGLSWKTGRQRHPQTDEGTQATFKNNVQ